MLHLSPVPAASHNVTFTYTPAASHKLGLGLAVRQPNFKTGITDTTEINGIYVL
jgi:hypothetical protein